MYQVKINLAATAQNPDDNFDFEAEVTYRNIPSRDGCDFVTANVIKSLFDMSNVKMDVKVNGMEVKSN